MDAGMDPGLEPLRRAIESCDSHALSELYADDAVILIMDRDHPPERRCASAAARRSSATMAGICDRDMTHTLEAAVADASHLAFTERCAYPDGTRVFCSVMADKVAGHITRQVTLQVWDG
jgi:ketosteroid isomerase-like protein